MSLPPLSTSRSIFEQLMTIFLPGVIVSTPFLLILSKLETISPDLATKTVFSFDQTSGSPLAILSLLSGIILMNLGSRIERCLDKIHNISNDAWLNYLLEKVNNDRKRIMHDYIKSIVFRFRMELSLTPALILFEIQWIVIYSF